MIEDDGTPGPDLRLVRGEATAEEVAALLTVIGAVSGTDAPAVPGPEPVSAWRDRAALLRPAVAPGPGAWRASGRPH